MIQQMVEQIVAFSDRYGNVQHPISVDRYELWRREYIWQALTGQHYGRSFCDSFGIHDNLLFYNSQGIEWADEYIRKHYVARS